ncbi:hypothetical protein FRB93_002098 [Tulasnella sp. JGI-2019a]|nr:hypothetical protein FRB93_002098 [Tulasnella sp. JGI-2019a]
MVEIPSYIEIPTYATPIHGASPAMPIKSALPEVGPPAPQRISTSSIFSSPPQPQNPHAPSSPTVSTKASNNISSILLSHALSALPVIPANLNNGQIRKPGDETLASAKDPLSLPIMSANFRRFIGKCQFIFWLQDRAEEVVFWRKGQLYTGAFMCAYTFFCFFPRLALLIPHVVLLHILFTTYQMRYPETTITSSSILGDDTTAEIAPVIQPGEGTPDWFANFQAIQNLMGFVSDAYDIVVPQLVHLTWTQPTTQPLFLFLLTSLILLLPIVQIIPLRPLFLTLGLAPFLLTHPTTRQVLPPLLLRFKPYSTIILRQIINNDQMSERHWRSERREVGIWENERWTSEKGWKAGNLRAVGNGERRPWTKDVNGWSGEEGIPGAPFDGSVRSVREVNLTLPQGWSFVETENWSVDLMANWRHVIPDQDGWIYTDDAWQNPSSMPLAEWKPTGMTRSRKWIRRMYELAASH